WGTTARASRQRNVPAASSPSSAPSPAADTSKVTPPWAGPCSSGINCPERSACPFATDRGFTDASTLLICGRSACDGFRQAARPSLPAPRCARTVYCTSLRRGGSVSAFNPGDEMKNHHLFVLGLVALIAAPAVALADTPPTADKKADAKPGKHPKDGMPGHMGMPGMRDGGAGHGEMRDGGAPRGMHDDDRDGGAPPHHGHKNAVRELFQDLKEGKIKKDELPAKLAQLNATRDVRRKEHREDVGNRWGATLARPPARDELKLHARRMAFLNRALVLAQTDTKPDKAKLIERITQLIDKEDARHDKAMARIASQPTTLASAAPAVPSAASEASGGS